MDVSRFTPRLMFQLLLKKLIYSYITSSSGGGVLEVIQEFGGIMAELEHNLARQSEFPICKEVQTPDDMHREMLKDFTAAWEEAKTVYANFASDDEAALKIAGGPEEVLAQLSKVIQMTMDAREESISSAHEAPRTVQ